jgi:ABC-2 type transport system ATP-binding protein
MPRAAGRKSAQRRLARNAIARDRQLETHVTTTPTLDRTGPGQDTPDEVPAAPDAPGTQAEADPLAEAEAPAPSEASAPAPVATTGQEVVVVEDVSVQFADQLAVDGISLIVPAGTILGIIGPSGSGKTTTIRVLTGALTPTSGTVRVLGEEPSKFRRQTRERIGYMPQSFTLYRDLTVRENVDFVGSLFGMLFRSRRRRTREVLELVDLWDVRSRRAGKLSGGMQRRLELAGALVHDPALMFLDEPTAGIDPLLRGRVWDEFHRLRDDGRTLLVTTQYVNEAESCDHVALIAEGQLIALGTPTELRRQAAGGDVVEIQTRERFDGMSLRELPFVRQVRQDGPDHVTLIVDDAGTATPDAVEAIARGGGDVVTARETRPTFDDVFAALVGRAAVASTTDASGAHDDAQTEETAA